MDFPSYKEKTPKIEDPNNLDKEALDSSPLSEPFSPESFNEPNVEPIKTYKSEATDLDVRSRMEQIKKESGTVGEFDSLNNNDLNGRSTDALKKAEIKESNSNQTSQNTSSGVSSRVSLFGYIPSTQVRTNAKDLEENGDIKNANTWLATLLNRLTGVLGG